MLINLSVKIKWKIPFKTRITKTVSRRNRRSEIALWLVEKVNLYLSSIPQRKFQAKVANTKNTVQILSENRGQENTFQLITWGVIIKTLKNRKSHRKKQNRKTDLSNEKT